MTKTRTEKFADWFNNTQIGGDDCGMPCNKTRFKLDGKFALKELANKIGIIDYDLRFNAGGMAVSGEVTLHAENIYIQIADSCMGKSKAIMFRTCKGKKDYSGGSNNFASINDLSNGRLEGMVRNLMVKP